VRADGLPQAGFAAECGGYRFEVISAKGPRITEIRAERVAPPPAERAD